MKLLRKRETVLKKREARLRAELDLVTGELAEIRVATRSMTATAKPKARPAKRKTKKSPRKKKVVAEVEALTCKQLVLKALTEDFQDGATASELLEFFKSEWGREIKRNSLSPQLSRLKREGKIALLGKAWMTSDQFDQQFQIAVEEVAKSVFDDDQAASE